MKKLLFAVLMFFGLVAQAATGHWEQIRLAHPMPAGMQGDYTYTSANAWITTYKGRQFALAVIDDGVGTLDVALAVLQGNQWLARMPRIVANVKKEMIATGPNGPRTTLEWFNTDVRPMANSLMDREINPSCPADKSDRLAAFMFDIGKGDFELDIEGHWYATKSPLSHAACP